MHRRSPWQRGAVVPKATVYLPRSVMLIEAVLEGMVQANQLLIRSGIVPPSPLFSGVRYQREGSGLEEWWLATKVIAKGYGDCEDLNGWAVAGARENGDAGARLVLYRTGPRMFHAVGSLSSGEVLDVCPALGMRQPPNHTLPGE